MTTRAGSARVAAVDGDARRAAERRAVVLGRSFVAPVALAATTVAAVAAAVLALLPAAVRRRPVGRRVEDPAALSGTAGEPVTP